jgi:hypothetical protein
MLCSWWQQSSSYTRIVCSAVYWVGCFYPFACFQWVVHQWRCVTCRDEPFQFRLILPVKFHWTFIEKYKNHSLLLLNCVFLLVANFIIQWNCFHAPQNPEKAHPCVQVRCSCASETVTGQSTCGSSWKMCWRLCYGRHISMCTTASVTPCSWWQQSSSFAYGVHHIMPTHQPPSNCQRRTEICAKARTATLIPPCAAPMPTYQPPSNFVVLGMQHWWHGASPVMLALGEKMSSRMLTLCTPPALTPSKLVQQCSLPVWCKRP